jgi:hypothetical protein
MFAIAFSERFENTTWVRQVQDFRKIVDGDGNGNTLSKYCEPY